MDRAELSESIIAEPGRVLGHILRPVLPALLAAEDLATVERAVQGLSRQVWGRLVEWRWPCR